MSESSSFPRTKYQALTMLYLQSLDLSKLTPKELAEKYNQVYDEISSNDFGAQTI